MILKDQIINIITPSLSASKFLIDVTVNPGNKIVVIIDDMKGISLDDCIAISRLVESSIDREKEDFELEVTSPGLLSPFKVHQQYIKNIGKEVEVILNNGEKQKGSLLSFQDNKIKLEIEEVVKEKNKKIKIKSIIEIEMDSVKQTKLVLSF